MSFAIQSVSTLRPNVAGSDGTTGTSGADTDTKTDTTTVAKPKSGLDREAFLKLLVAQLRYQDPSKPMDASQMISQTAQLTMVDKLESMATMMEASTLTGRLSLAGSVIGKEITFKSEDGVTVKDVVTSVRFADDGSLILHTGDWDVPMDTVEAIGAATTAPTTPAPVTTPASTTPVTTPASTTPASTTPVTTPASTTPASTTPVSTTPASTTPASTTPASTTPASTTPVATGPATSDPATSDPAPADPVAIDPVPA